MRSLFSAIIIAFLCSSFANFVVSRVNLPKEVATLFWAILFALSMFGFMGLIIYKEHNRIKKEEKERQIREEGRPIGP